MRTDQMPQLSNLEKAYCQTPETMGLTPKLAVIGGGTGALHLLRRLIQHLEATGRRITPGEIVVFEGGTLDILSHMGNSGLPRIQLQEAAGLARVGGRSTMFGGWSPRPAEERLTQWPFKLEAIHQHFDEEERELGIPDPIPLSGRRLDHDVTERLTRTFSRDSTACQIRAAPLAIDAAGHRWSSLDKLSDLLERGVSIIPHARIHRLEREGCRIAAVNGSWFGRPFVCNPHTLYCLSGWKTPWTF